jgi:hypothetical protein
MFLWGVLSGIFLVFALVFVWALFETCVLSSQSNTAGRQAMICYEGDEKILTDERRIAMAEEKKISFTDLKFENTFGGLMTEKRPARILQCDNHGHPVLFDAFGSYGNVRDINYTIDCGAGIRLGRGLWKEWVHLHRLLASRDDD